MLTLAIEFVFVYLWEVSFTGRETQGRLERRSLGVIETGPDYARHGFWRRPSTSADVGLKERLNPV